MGIGWDGTGIALTRDRDRDSLDLIFKSPGVSLILNSKNMGIIVLRATVFTFFHHI